MQIIGGRRATYLYLSGLKIDRPVNLGAGLDLIPGSISCTDRMLRAVTSHATDYHIASLVAPSIGSQLKVSGQGSRDVAVKTWNATWDVLLLGALFDVELFAILHSTTDATKITSKSTLHVTHYHVPLFVFKPGTHLAEDVLQVLEGTFPVAQRLMHADKRYQNAMHCLSTYRWHSLPRAQLALIWSGIEGLFGVDSEITFRISLYVARFLASGDHDQQKDIFKMMKRLYAQRSKAVHGSEIKSDPKEVVGESARILRSLLLQCAIEKKLPVLDELAP